MKRKNNKEIKQNDRRSKMETYKKKHEKFVDEIVTSFFDETLGHCEDYHLARAKLEETLDQNQEPLFHYFTIVAEIESRDRQRMLVKFVLKYIFERMMKKEKLG